MSSEQQIENFKNLIRSTEEANPVVFSMSCYARPDCGSPACVLGNYAVRSDLQQVFELVQEYEDGYYVRVKGTPERLEFRFALWRQSGGPLQEHFGLSGEECELLFATDGCGGADTPEEAVVFLRRFAEERQWL